MKARTLNVLAAVVVSTLLLAAIAAPTEAGIFSCLFGPCCGGGYYRGPCCGPAYVSYGGCRSSCGVGYYSPNCGGCSPCGSSCSPCAIGCAPCDSGTCSPGIAPPAAGGVRGQSPPADTKWEPSKTPTYADPIPDPGASGKGTAPDARKVNPESGLDETRKREGEGASATGDDTGDDFQRPVRSGTATDTGNEPNESSGEPATPDSKKTGQKSPKPPKIPDDMGSTHITPPAPLKVDERIAWTPIADRSRLTIRSAPGDARLVRTTATTNSLWARSATESNVAKK